MGDLAEAKSRPPRTPPPSENVVSVAVAIQLVCYCNAQRLGSFASHGVDVLAVRLQAEAYFPLRAIHFTPPPPPTPSPTPISCFRTFRCNTDCATFPDHCISERLYQEATDALVSGGYLAAGYIVRVDANHPWATKNPAPKKKTLSLTLHPLNPTKTARACI